VKARASGSQETAPPELRGSSILVVDDERSIARLLERFLKRLGYDAAAVSNVEEAIEKITRTEFALVITDLRMPGASGLDLLLEVRARSPDTRLIMMSGNADVPSAASAIDRGIDSLVIKPFGLDEIRERVEDALQRRRREMDSVRERQVLEFRVREREQESRSLVLRAAHSLAAAVDVKDAYTAGHAIRVSSYAVTLAEHIGSIDLDAFRLGADLHDVGKIGIPDEVLNKPGRLTTEEMDRVREHPAAGAHILKPLIDDPLVIGMVRWHHERWDGNGYPDGLAERDVPLPARILAVADTLDAMTSRRPYREGMPWQDAVEELLRHAGTQFDPEVVAAFDAVRGKLKEDYEKFLRSEGVESGFRRSRRIVSARAAKR